MIRHQHTGRLKALRTTHEKVVLRRALRAVLDSDLGEDDVEKLGRERLHVRG